MLKTQNYVFRGVFCLIFSQVLILSFLIVKAQAGGIGSPYEMPKETPPITEPSKVNPEPPPLEKPPTNPPSQNIPPSQIPSQNIPSSPTQKEELVKPSIFLNWENWSKTYWSNNQVCREKDGFVACFEAEIAKKQHGWEIPANTSFNRSKKSIKSGV